MCLVVAVALLQLELCQRQPARPLQPHDRAGATEAARSEENNHHDEYDKHVVSAGPEDGVVGVRKPRSGCPALTPVEVLSVRTFPASLPPSKGRPEVVLPFLPRIDISPSTDDGRLPADALSFGCPR